MTKSEVLEFFGGSKRAAYALDVTDSAVRMWPETLGYKLAARVIVAGIQHRGVQETRQRFPDMFERSQHPA